jgi:perosamine synthetase
MINRIPWWSTRLDDDDKQRLIEAFDNRKISMGSVSAELEEIIRQKLNVPYALVTPSGTAALTLALIGSGVGPDDEVIVPDLTWIATAQAAHIIGCKVKLVDCGADLPVIDVDQIESAITDKTRAIIPVHLNGRPCDMERLGDIARANNIKLIEDACKAMRSQDGDRYLGTIGDAGCFSMGMISLISVGYGGFVVTHDKDLFETMTFMRDHGVNRTNADEYLHDGFNFKLSDLLAAIGVGQWTKVDEKTEHILHVYQRYESGLKNLDYISLIPVDTQAGQLPLLVDVQSPYREEIASFLESQDVEISKFHPALHNATYLASAADHDDFPNATRFALEGFVLPSGPSQSMDNVDRVIDLLSNWSPH